MTCQDSLVLPRIDEVSRRNFWAHGIEGGLFMGGLTFVAFNTILPQLTQRLNAPVWVTGLTPVLLMIGFALPTLFTAHFIERQQRVMPMLLFAGVVQRIPYLIAGLLLLLAPRPRLALWVVVLTPLVSGLAGGVIVTAWQELVAKTIAARRRSSVFALRNILSSLIGLGAGGVIAMVLERFPGIRGYGILHLLSFGFLALSYGVFMLIREADSCPRDPANHCSLGENLREMPSLVLRDRRFRSFLVSGALFNGVFILVPFVPLAALRSTGNPDSFLGLLVISQMGGGIAGDLFAAWFGDRYGSRVVMFVSRFVCLALCVAALFASSAEGFILLNVLLGFVQMSGRVAAQVMGIEVCPYQKRATFLAILSFTNVPAMLMASVAGSWLWSLSGQLVLPAVATAAAMLFSTLALAMMPRNGKEYPHGRDGGAARASVTLNKGGNQ